MSSGRTYKHYLLRQAAADGQLVFVRCGRCRRTVTFLATDLVLIIDPNRDAMDPPYPCSKCQREDMIHVALRLPSPGDYADLVIRRPGRVKHIQTWRSVKLGD